VVFVPWEQAWEQALYADDGFFRGAEGPAGHFRTAVHAAAIPLAQALARLAAREGRAQVLDAGAGRGELLTAVAALPEAAHLALHAVDVVGRPPELPARVGWSAGLGAVPAEVFDGALVIAWELLDDVPCPVLEIDADGAPRTVLVDPESGRETLGGPPPAGQLAWCRRWWPAEGAEPGDRIEVGLPRDALWVALVRRAASTPDGATLLAVDYHHLRGDRPATGTLSGYRAGRLVPPVPDGSCDVTAHVALDAVAAAGETAGATGTRLTGQRTALAGLGVRDGLGASSGPGPALPGGGAGLLRALARRSAVAELLDPGALGGFGWLVQRIAGLRDR
jgi:SAM-dependent MidA family methyltransferase